MAFIFCGDQYRCRLSCVFTSAFLVKQGPQPGHIMSLEVDGRPRGVPILRQDERRGFQVCERAGSLL